MSRAPLVRIVPTGIANLASIAAGFERAGARVALAQGEADIIDASHVVVPGVGAFGAAMTRLQEDGHADAIRERLARDRPTLAVCLGMHLLFEASEESPGARGLGVFPGTIERFRGVAIVPQMGWNDVVADDRCTLLRSGAAYFANSFRAGVAVAPACCGVALAEYGGRFIAAFERGALLACQFHPELSALYGLGILRRFLLASHASHTEVPSC